MVITSTARLLFISAQQLGLRPQWVKKGHVFAIATELGERYVHFARSTGNSQLATSLSSNKLLTRLIFERHGLPNIPYLHTSMLDSALTFLEEHAIIIAKPLAGHGAQGVTIISQPKQLVDIPLDTVILEKYIAGVEMRYLVLDGRVIAVHRSEYGTSVQEDRILKRISYPVQEWDESLVKLSITATRALGLHFATMDYLIIDSKAYLLEANSRPGFKWFHYPSSGPVVDVASLFLRDMIQREALACAPVQARV